MLKQLLLDMPDWARSYRASDRGTGDMVPTDSCIWCLARLGTPLRAST